MKKYIVISFALAITLLTTLLFTSGCKVSEKINSKTGTQLWGENCSRCHNAPGPGEFSAANWEIIGMHMRVRAHITETEEKKIIGYLKATGN